MNFYKQCVLCTCVLLSAFVASPQDYIFRFDAVLHHVKQASYGQLKVIDMRADKSSLGKLKTGALNRPRSITTEKPLPDFLGGYYRSTLNEKRDDGKQLVLVLYEFEMVDRVNGGEVGTFYFDGEFFASQNNQYAFLGKVDSIYEATSAWDVTQILLRTTKEKLSSILTRYASLQLPGDYNLIEDDMLRRRQKIKSMYPIYQTTSYKKGIYYTVEQFLNNEPVDTPFIRSVIFPPGGQKQIYFYYLNAKGKKGKPLKGDMYFAIYDGKDWAVPGQFYAETMRVVEGEFYANLPFTGVFDKSSWASAGMMFGLAGAVLAATTVPGDLSATRGIYKAKFDPETKTFVPQKRLN